MPDSLVGRSSNCEMVSVGDRGAGGCREGSYPESDVVLVDMVLAHEHLLVSNSRQRKAEPTKEELAGLHLQGKLVWVRRESVVPNGRDLLSRSSNFSVR